MYTILFDLEKKVLTKVNKNDVIDGLYLSKYTLPHEDDIKKYVGTDKFILNLINKYSNHTDLIIYIKKIISKINNKIPLYDIRSKNLYVINKYDVYDYIMNKHYRFPEIATYILFEHKKEKLYKKLNVANMNGDKTINQNVSDTTILDKHIYLNFVLKIREYRKLVLMLKFLDNFDPQILYNTYVQTFYKYSDQIGMQITFCVKPSFINYFKYLTPFYSKYDVINLGLNMELISPTQANKYIEYLYTNSKKYNFNKLCKKITLNDISSKTIIDHYLHIIKYRMSGIVQYYTLQGSYFMNKYLRSDVNYKYKNELLEIQISLLWNLILHAPSFNKEYVLYRFIHEDTYLKHLNVNDIYVSDSFISTTRDPFYQSDTYKFGFILIKIKIPANVKGIALCIETLSHFQSEQEIILPPLSKYILEKKDSDIRYYHSDKILAEKIKTRYEFRYLGFDEIKFIDRPPFYDDLIIDFIKIDNVDTETLEERVNFFTRNYINALYQFNVVIGKQQLIIIAEWYDSTSVYKNYYANITDKGFSLYTIYDQNIIFFIEIGYNDDGEICMWINYYFRKASNTYLEILNEEDMILFYSKVGYYFRVNKIILYSNYSSCSDSGSIDNKIDESDDNEENYVFNDTKYTKLYGGNYSKDIYEYVKYGTRRFVEKFDSDEIYPYFEYSLLDELSNYRFLDYDIELNKFGNIYVFYKMFKSVFGDDDTIKNFYVWIIDNYCSLITDFIDLTNHIYDIKENPFVYDYYVLDYKIIMINRKLLSSGYVFNAISSNIADNLNKYRL